MVFFSYIRNFSRLPFEKAGMKFVFYEMFKPKRHDESNPALKPSPVKLKSVHDARHLYHGNCDSVIIHLME